MARGIGIDAVEIERIRSARRRIGARFTERILSEEERGILATSSTPDTFLAGRFAAKEAVLKVLGTGLGRGISWQQVSVIREPSGAPRVVLAGRALERARRLGIDRILLSISHCREYATAQALGVGAGPHPER